MWTVTVDAAKVEALRRHAWGSDPFLPNRGAGDPFRIRMVDGRCFFLAEDNRCRIHTELGYEAKPEGCKAFPLHLAEVGGTTYARLSFYCPTVTRNEGKPLREQSRWVNATRKAAGELARKAPVTLDGTLELSTQELAAIEQALLASLERREAPVADRLAAGSALLRRLASAAGAAGKSGLRPALAEAQALEFSSLAAEGRRGGRPSRAGPVLSLLLGQDCRPTKLSRFARFFGVRLAGLGLTPLRSHHVAARARFGALRKVAFDPPTEQEELLTRYLTHKLRARRHLVGDASLFGGFNLLVAAYAVVNVLARLQAAQAGRGRCAAEEVTRAVEAADLLVLEHSTLYHSDLFAALTQSVLASPTLCSDLLARLGGGAGEGGRDE